ncbi:MAG TPA: ABC transporter substrate-binding protein [Pseudomonas xinjiangensis]|uniref:ABC transporter substrate-binding protein n=2 Tax=root TaxID=1 RepID=A0A7V1FRI2_9GAMM|nr:ABC transporter substrate-binding protein [Halopseudomonas xinjiangensis]HEC47658.1 ABC transporter substrate-binding protein [Halopseudomonas xinjiangensis]
MKAKLLLVPVMMLLSAVAQAQESLKVGYIRVMDDAQVMVAKEAGLYEKHGLNVELVEFSSGTDLIKAIVGGQLDTGVLGFTNAVAWASKGANLKVVGGAQRGYHSILVREETGIETVADLKGKTLASQRQGSTADAVLRGVTLKGANLEAGDLNIMGVSPAVAVQSLVSGRVDAAFLFEPYDRIARLVAPVKQIYEIGEVWPFPCMVVITAGETLDKRKEAIWSSLDAQRDAIDMLENKPAEAAELIAEYFIAEPTLKTLERGEVPREKVIEEAIATQDFDAALSEQDLGRIQELANIMQEQGSLTTRDGKPFDTSAILDLSWQQAREL